MRRVGLGRHGQLDSDVGDPLDGLVNLFDVGIVLAVAFLIAGLGLAIDPKTGAVEKRPTTTSPTQGQERTLTTPEQPSTAKGRGQAVGTVYRLPDGRLVLVDPNGKPAAP
ncbi:DUF2149 domain-containing protein [Patulibacter defluvii]|uniref:DUF2149 domain-containing protein n=1 Tax=Patulibacter defluvii TaxID=3095358 RepID=UPI002A75F1E7|nr:DUF2149 domain-containing protein [Patulibacter sp. DM4]